MPALTAKTHFVIIIYDGLSINYIDMYNKWIKWQTSASIIALSLNVFIIIAAFFEDIKCFMKNSYSLLF